MLFIGYLLPSRSSEDPIDKIAMLIKQGNIHELSAMFAQSIEVGINGEDNVYSKTQAEMMLVKFFNDNKVRSVKMLHKVNSNSSYSLGVLIINTDKGAFRIACTLKQLDSSPALIEMRIETEKIK